MLHHADASPVTLGPTPIEVRPNGWRVYRGVATHGDVLLDYGSTDAGGPRVEFVPASTALDPETVRLTCGIPFTVIHPEDLLHSEDEAGLREHTEGAVLAARPTEDEGTPAMEVDVIVYTASAQQAIESGAIRELSLGYEAACAEMPGEHQGRRYDVVQVRRRPNHLSAVPRARSRTADGRRARLDSGPLPGERGALGEPPAPPVLGVRLDAMQMPPAPTDHPASAAEIHEYRGDVPGWRGWSEDRSMSWIAFWPSDDGPGALWTSRSPTGAVLGTPSAIRRADEGGAYAHGKPTGATMDETDATTTDTQDAPAVVTEGPAAPPDGDPAEALAAFPPEDQEVLKTLTPDGMALLARAMMAMGAAPVVAEVAQVEEDAAKPAGETAMEPKDMLAQMKDMLDQAKAALAGAAPRTDADKAPAPKTEATRADAASIARTVQADLRFVDRARGWGLRCDSAEAATAAMLDALKKHSPDLEPVAREAVAAGRRDHAATVFEAVERARRDALLQEQALAVGGDWSGQGTAHLDAADPAASLTRLVKFAT